MHTVGAPILKAARKMPNPAYWTKRIEDASAALNKGRPLASIDGPAVVGVGAPAEEEKQQHGNDIAGPPKRRRRKPPRLPKPEPLPRFDPKQWKPSKIKQTDVRVAVEPRLDPRVDVTREPYNGMWSPAAEAAYFLMKHGNNPTKIGELDDYFEAIGRESRDYGKHKQHAD